MEGLKQLTGKKNITLVKRGNRAILLALRAARELGKNKLLIQDQGSWITYKQYARKLKLDIIGLKTDYGLIDIDNLKKNIDKDYILLINSMPGYHALEDMKAIENISKQYNSFIINDATGSIGTKQARYGNIIVGSFGSNKPIDIGYGGFIAFDDDNLKFEDEFDNKFLDRLKHALKGLDQKLDNWNSINKKIKACLKDYDIIHKDKHGINVIVKFNNNNEKEYIIDYCKKNNYEYTTCPREIRVNCDAISIEVKKCH